MEINPISYKEVMARLNPETSVEESDKIGKKAIEILKENTEGLGTLNVDDLAVTRRIIESIDSQSLSALKGTSAAMYALIREYPEKEAEFTIKFLNAIANQIEENDPIISKKITEMAKEEKYEEAEAMLARTEHESSRIWGQSEISLWKVKNQYRPNFETIWEFFDQVELDKMGTKAINNFKQMFIEVANQKDYDFFAEIPDDMLAVLLSDVPKVMLTIVENGDDGIARQLQEQTQCMSRDLLEFEIALHETIESGKNSFELLALAEKIPDNEERNQALVKLCDIQLKERHLDKAAQVVDKVTQSSKEFLLRSISEEYAKQGNFDKAVETARLISTSQGRHNSIEALKMISIEMAKQGQITRAVEFSEANKGVSSASVKAEILLIRAEKEGVLEIFHESVRNQENKSTALNKMTYEKLLISLCELAVFQNQNAIEDIINNFEGTFYPKSLLRSKLAIAFAAKGQLDQAIEQVNQIQKGALDRNHTLKAIAFKLIEVGNFQQAWQMLDAIGYSPDRYDAIQESIQLLKDLYLKHS